MYYDGLTRTILLARSSALVDKREIEATEDFLDSYFMQVELDPCYLIPAW